MSPQSTIDRAVAQLTGHLGLVAREERIRRGWSLRDLAQRAGLSISCVHAIEHGRPASVSTYVAIGSALGLEPAFDLIDPRNRARAARQEDPVHAAMGEAIAERLGTFDRTIALDDPYQHYQFAGRADVLAWSLESRALLHVENRTRFPNLQDAFGSYNAKRRYLPADLAQRLGLRGGWNSVTNVVVALWSSEVLHDLRLHRASFNAVCPDSIDPFATWWGGTLRDRGAPTSSLALLDPIGGGRSDRRRFVGQEAVPSIRARYAGYADALAALRTLGRA